MKTTIITQPKLRLITSRSLKFPEGNRAAFNSLEKQLKTLRGRKFYGLVFENDAGLDYYAGLVPDNEIEERRFATLGFPITVIEGGLCARVKLMDWSTKLDQIGPTIGTMIAQHGIDHSRPQMEYYRSFTELHLLVPIPSRQRTDSPDC